MSGALPLGLWQAMDRNFVDQDLWLASYTEEYEALLQENTMDIIDHEEYLRLRNKCGDSLPTMCVFCIEKVAQGRPIRAKSRIVVLGNLDTTPWTKGDCFAPVVGQAFVCLLVSKAVEQRHVLKQADSSLRKRSWWFVHPLLVLFLLRAHTGASVKRCMASAAALLIGMTLLRSFW
jgi:hypothetical protein